MIKIYIAGFDVFEPNAKEIGKKYTSLCKKHNLIGLFPLDNELNLPCDTTKQQTAYAIYKANKTMIEKCDVVIANLNPFRGKEPDSGTVWECGYAKALGKTVIGYMDNTKDYIETFGPNEKNKIDEMIYCKDGFIIEDFNNPLNLMVSCSCDKIIQGDFKKALNEVGQVNKEENSYTFTLNLSQEQYKNLTDVASSSNIDINTIVKLAVLKSDFIEK